MQKVSTANEVITDPNLRKFVRSSVSDDFGLSVAQVAENCKNDGRFKVWLNSDIVKIVEVLNKVKSNGVSPAFFAAYEKTEGYNSSWGWLNHTRVNGNPVTDADSVSKWVETQSRNTTDKPAWIDFANYKDFVPASVKSAGNADFANMTLGSIGKVVIAGTAAATWEVYYPLGLLKEYNGVQNYGAPINAMMNFIVTWGGNIEGGGGGGKPFYPVPSHLTISSPYGPRWGRFHDGIDFGGGGSEHPIYATQSGIVVVNSFNDLSGYYIQIQHTGDHYWSGYQHFAVKSPMAVGTTVTKGQVIGTMGTTGDSSGIHLHFQIATRADGFWTEEGTIDPELYLEMDFGGDAGSPEQTPYFIVNRHNTNMRRMGTRGRR